MKCIEYLIEMTGKGLIFLSITKQFLMNKTEWLVLTK